MVGSSNLTENALVTNHEWNLKVTAAHGSDLAAQFDQLTREQIACSVPLTEQWIAEYEATYVVPPRPTRRRRGAVPENLVNQGVITPNSMQMEALAAIAAVREAGEKRAIVISATGTGKTILSALDVRAAAPERMLFVVHREQIIDRTLHEYQRVLGGSMGQYGKLTGGVKDFDARYLFATVQTLSQPDVLQLLHPEAFDYIVFDEVSHPRV